MLTTGSGVCRRPLFSSPSYHASVSRQSSPSTSSSSSIFTTKAAPGETNHRPGIWEKASLSLFFIDCFSSIMFSVFSFKIYLGFHLQTRPFSPPVSGSPPPFAPLARAESSSSISSITSQSAASTPTLGRDLNISTTGIRPIRWLLCSSPGSAAHLSPHVVCHSLCPCLTVLSLSMILSS